MDFRKIPAAALTILRAMALGLGLLAVSLSAQSTWTVRDSGTTANLWGVAYRPPQSNNEPAGQTVVCGEHGVILTSADEGVTWTRRVSGTSVWLTAAAYVSGLNLFFIVGDGGTILSSPDGTAWTREASPTTVRLNSVSVGETGNTVTAVGEAGAELLTRDATGKWSQRDAGFGNRWMRGMLPSAESVVGQGGAILSAQTNDATSPPARSWQPVPLPITTDIEAVTLGSFFQGPLPVAVGANGAIFQGRGMSWTPRTSGTTQRLRGVCWKQGGFVTIITLIAVRSIGEFFAVGTGGTILRSADGVTWVADATPTQNNLNAVGGTLHDVIAVGDGGIILQAGGTGAAPVITQQPTTDMDEFGVPYAQASATGSGQRTYFWVQLSAGAPYPVGEDFPRQSLARAPFGVVGNAFQLLVGNAFGITRSAPFTPNRFINLAARASVGTGDDVLIGGFAIGGTDLPRTRTMLVRAVGPGLAASGIGNALKAPRLSVYSGSQLIATNTGWDTTAQAADIRAAAQNVGAFPLATGSTDCALMLSLAPGNYTAQVASADGSTGVALVEVFDTQAPDLSRLRNLSARAQVQNGDGVLIGGFVIDGGVRKSVLLRAAGPTLAEFGFQRVLAQPKLTLFKDGAVVAAATSWSAALNAAQISSSAKTVNAFPFPDGSADAAMLLQLDPGAYSLQVAGADGGTGVALVEVYEAPQ